MAYLFRELKGSTNLQIGEIVDAMAQTEPELFGEGNAVLMPVHHYNQPALVICDRALTDTVSSKIE